MEFIKVGKNYMIKNSNGRIVSEKEKLQLENNELIIKDFKSNECQGKTTQKIKKNKKRIKEIEKENNEALKEYSKIIEENWKETAPIKGEDGADDIIEETDSTI